ncbi:Transcriptional regulator PadR-like family protein [Streptosporangium subroseum]|uniref:Transcriptional regulator PadR-like family protein n=1 Tax=Streptosporangium subroseum TaxID=106412 RepID=A0A239P080_9ACTN|nr:PadR family transcriptional regulator [Streptosporangium subroseum]SNT60531.1 Transcriptional regulator PadR-like family protein [Streptosporangium subroseum]
MGRSPFRLTLQTLLVLRVLLDDLGEEHYGLELAAKTGLPNGSIYPILARLERAGWVDSDWEDINEAAEGRRRRRYYRLTTRGALSAREALASAAQALTPAGDEVIASQVSPRHGDTERRLG